MPLQFELFYWVFFFCLIHNKVRITKTDGLSSLFFTVLSLKYFRLCNLIEHSLAPLILNTPQNWLSTIYIETFFVRKQFHDLFTAKCGLSRVTGKLFQE